MKISFLKLNLFIILALFSMQLSLKAQGSISYQDLSVDDYLSLTLPPLDLLFETAKNSPSYKSADVEVLYHEKLLSKEKKAFLSFFNLRASYQYGMFTNDGSYNDVYQPAISNYSKQSQHLYSVGASISIPLDELFDLRGRVNRQKLMIEKRKWEREKELDKLKMEIVSLYNTAISQINLLKLRAEALTLATVEYNIVERQFANGTVDSGTLATEKSKLSIERGRYETSRAELTKSLLTLEILTQTPIIRK